MDLKKEYTGRSTRDLIFICLLKLHKLEQTIPQTIEVPVCPGSHITTKDFVVTELKIKKTGTPR